MDVFCEVKIGKDKFSKGQLKTQKEICRVKGNIRYYICDAGNVHEIVYADFRIKENECFVSRYND